MHPTLTTRQHSAAKFFLLALFIITIDQLSKWAVHTYMQPGSAGEIPVLGQFAKLNYTLNPGMAFGAHALGFLRPGGRARLSTAGPWTRLDAPGGFVLGRPAMAV